MDYYRYNAFLEKLPWIENLLEERVFIGYSHLNVSIIVKSINMDFFTSKLDIGLSSLQTDLGEKGGPIVINSVSLDSVWIGGNKEQSFVILVKDILKMRESGENLDFLERPVYELLVRCYAEYFYLVLVFRKPDTNNEEGPPFIDIVILKPEERDGFGHYLRKIEDGVIEGVKKELGL